MEDAQPFLNPNGLHCWHANSEPPPVMSSHVALPSLSPSSLHSIIEEIRRATELINRARKDFIVDEPLQEICSQICGQTDTDRKSSKVQEGSKPRGPGVTGSVQRDIGGQCPVRQSTPELTLAQLYDSISSIETKEMTSPEAKEKSGRPHREINSWIKQLKLDYLQPKYDHILPEVESALHFVGDPAVKSQFEALLNDFRGVFLSSKGKDINTVSLFLDDIRNWLKDRNLPAGQIVDQDKFRAVSSNATLRLRKAKVLQHQVTEISAYFSSQLKKAEKERERRRDEQAFNGVDSHVALSALFDDLSRPSSPELVAPHPPEACPRVGSADDCGGGDMCGLDDAGVPKKDHCSEISDLLEQMQDLSRSLKVKECRLAALKKSNSLLTQQIEEVESTLEACDMFIERMKRDRLPVMNDLLRREMCAFQESMIERIFCCIDVLYEQLRPLHAGEREKSRKSTTGYRNFKKLKIEEEILDNRLLIVDNVEAKTDEADPHFSNQRFFHDNLYTVMKTIVSAIDLFHETCVDLWGETLQRVTGEIEVLLGYCRRWKCPDSIAADLKKLKSLPTTGSGSSSVDLHGDVITSSLKMLERIGNEFGRLMIVTRLRDLQLITIDHKIGIVYFSLTKKAALLFSKRRKLAKLRDTSEKMSRSMFEIKMTSTEKKPKSKLTLSPTFLNMETGKNHACRKSPKDNTKRSDRPPNGSAVNKSGKTDNGTSETSILSSRRDTDVRSSDLNKNRLKKVTKKRSTNSESKKDSLKRPKTEKKKTSARAKGKKLGASNSSEQHSSTSLQLLSDHIKNSTRPPTPHMASFSEMRVPLQSLSGDLKSIAVKTGSKVELCSPQPKKDSGLSPWITAMATSTAQSNCAKKNAGVKVEPQAEIAETSSVSRLRDTFRSPMSNYAQCSLRRKASPPRLMLKLHQKTPAPQFKKEVIEFKDDKGRPVDCKGNVVNIINHKTIYYGHIMPTPTPPAITTTAAAAAAHTTTTTTVHTTTTAITTTKTTLVKAPKAQAKPNNKHDGACKSPGAKLK